jgi:hypothetical protein
MVPLYSNSNIGKIFSCLPGIGFYSFLYEVLTQKTPGKLGFYNKACSSHIYPVYGNGHLVPEKSYVLIVVGSSHAASIETADYG